MLSSQKEFVDNVEIHEPLGSSDHNQLHFNINIKSDKTKVKQCRRDFRRGNYDEIRKSLAVIDWNDKMNNKTATECWNILRGELDRAIDSYVPMKKQGKRSKKKHLSKEAFRKIRYSSTCHGRPPPVQRKSGPSWQVAPRDRERTYAPLCQIKHTHQTAYISQHMHNIMKHSGQLQCCIGLQ